MAPSGADQESFKPRANAQRDSLRNASVLAVFHRAGQDASIWLAIENISLAAVAEGLGSGITFYASEERSSR
jgi:hypothetical protein